MSKQERYNKIQDQYRWYSQQPRYQTAEAQSFIKEMMKHNDDHMATGEGCLVSGMRADLHMMKEA